MKIMLRRTIIAIATTAIVVIAFASDEASAPIPDRAFVPQPLNPRTLSSASAIKRTVVDEGARWMDQDQDFGWDAINSFTDGLPSMPFQLSAFIVNM